MKTLVRSNSRTEEQSLAKGQFFTLDVNTKL